MLVKAYDNRGRRWFVPAANPEGYNLTRTEWQRDITVVVLITLAFCAFAGFWFARTALFVRHASKATGTLTSFSLREDIENTTTWDVTATFSDPTGAFHTVKTEWFAPFHGPLFNKGDAIDVLYDPSSPDHAQIDAFATLWYWKLFGTGFVLVMWLWAAFFVLIVRYPPGSRLIDDRYVR
jgi:hypothetical protein